MTFIQTEAELLHAIRHRPIWVAESLQRIGRFGGQHPASNVLIHSLDVHERVLWAKPNARPEVLCYACLHDVHELLSGDISRAWKSPAQDQRQEYVDRYLIHNLNLDMDADEEQLIRFCDTASGDWERGEWCDTRYKHWPNGRVAAWCSIVEAVVR